MSCLGMLAEVRAYISRVAGCARQPRRTLNATRLRRYSETTMQRRGLKSRRRRRYMSVTAWRRQEAMEMLWQRLLPAMMARRRGAMPPSGRFARRREPMRRPVSFRGYSRSREHIYMTVDKMSHERACPPQSSLPLRRGSCAFIFAAAYAPSYAKKVGSGGVLSVAETQQMRVCARRAFIDNVSVRRQTRRGVWRRRNIYLGRFCSKPDAPRHKCHDTARYRACQHTAKGSVACERQAVLQRVCDENEG